MICVTVRLFCNLLTDYCFSVTAQHTERAKPSSRSLKCKAKLWEHEKPLIGTNNILEMK